MTIFIEFAFSISIIVSSRPMKKAMERACNPETMPVTNPLFTGENHSQASMYPTICTMTEPNAVKIPYIINIVFILVQLMNSTVPAIILINPRQRADLIDKL